MVGKDADAIERSVRRRQISCIWHMTRINQLRSILANGGLLSRARMNKKGIAYQMSGWGSIAKAVDLKDYICCSLVPPWGMSRNQRDRKVLIKTPVKAALAQRHLVFPRMEFKQ